MSNISSVDTKEAFEEFIDKNSTVVINFWASWSTPSVQLNDVVTELAKNYPSIKFLTLEAEKHEDISAIYKVQAVPHFIFIKDKKVVDELQGANPPELTKKIKSLSELPSSSTSSSSSTENLNARLEKLISYAPVMLFMKGVPSAPQCKFSRQMVEFLAKKKVHYSSFNILADETVREGLKTYSNWKTYPQLYINGKLIGGLDVAVQLDEEGEFEKLIPSQALGGQQEEKEEEIEKRLVKLINKSAVMLFMKGSPAAPQCGFSNKIVQLLQTEGIKFETFDILTDQAVREGLKEYSSWPTYPQLYVNGKLLGGLDVVNELSKEGELLGLIPESHKISKN